MCLLLCMVARMSSAGCTGPKGLKEPQEVIKSCKGPSPAGTGSLALAVQLLSTSGSFSPRAEGEFKSQGQLQS